MKTILRNVAAVLAGIFIGSCVNMAIITVGQILVPLPEGADVSTMEAVRESIKLFTPLHFINTWLAHALGTLAGAFIAAKLAASHKLGFALGIGGFFLLGGISMVAMVGGPLWFAVADLLFAYLPMAYLGARLAGAERTTSKHAI